MTNYPLFQQTYLVNSLTATAGTWRRTHELWDGRGSPLIEMDGMPAYRRAPLLPLRD